MNESELVVVHHSRVKGADRANYLVSYFELWEQWRIRRMGTYR